MVHNYNESMSERGNVLFLILIAVALFAALSYAVTQSTRSGGGSAEKEKAILSSASMTQHPTAMRTGLVRMILSGVEVSQIRFDAPANFATVSDLGVQVFHPEGGGAVFQYAPADVMAGTSQGVWFFNANFDIPQIGTTDEGSASNDIIAFLPGISQNACRQANIEFTVVTTGCTMSDNIIPDLAGAITEANIRVNIEETAGNTFPTGNQENLAAQGCNAFVAQPSGCFNDTTNDEYVFYSVLLER